MIYTEEERQALFRAVDIWNLREDRLFFGKESEIYLVESTGHRLNSKTKTDEEWKKEVEKTRRWDLEEYVKFLVTLKVVQ
jgi:hypothetical protein